MLAWSIRREMKFGATRVRDVIDSSFAFALSRDRRGHPYGMPYLTAQLYGPLVSRLR